MTGSKIREKRVLAGITGRLLCAKAGMDPSRLSHIERGYVQPSQAELERLGLALEQLVDARRKIAKVAAESGWPIPV